MKHLILFYVSMCLACITAQAQSLPDPAVSPFQAGAYVPGIMGVRDYANAKYYFTYGEKQHFNTDVFQIQLIFTPGWLQSKPAEETKD